MSRSSTHLRKIMTPESNSATSVCLWRSRSALEDDGLSSVHAIFFTPSTAPDGAESAPVAARDTSRRAAVWPTTVRQMVRARFSVVAGQRPSESLPEETAFTPCTPPPTYLPRIAFLRISALTTSASYCFASHPFPLLRPWCTPPPVLPRSLPIPPPLPALPSPGTVSLPPPRSPSQMHHG